MKKLLILGSTGSIGTQALEVIGALRRAPGRRPRRRTRLGAVGRAGARARRAGDRARRPRRRRARPATRWSGRVLAGEEGVRELIADLRAPTWSSTAIVGAAGLGSTVVALTEGIDVALANKESLVVGGELVMALAEATGRPPAAGRLRALGAAPADRRRGAGDGREAGPDRLRRPLPRPRPTSAGVSVEDALAHPTWEMGGRITIDSATLMNKGFEAIEAHHLFGVALRADRRRRPPAVAGPLADPPQRRLLAGPPRLPRHAGADLLRAALPRARRRRPCRSSTSPTSAR